jgi:aryl-phospho-beta-D-glucosidase BglC (GH1 family)
MNRRKFLHHTAAAVTFAAATPITLRSAPLPNPGPGKLPLWRGFNLLEKFTQRKEGNPPFLEDDFRMIADFGFNFVRLPMSYLCWTDRNDWTRLSREEELKHIDQAVEFGRRHKIHVNLNFHRAPGYCVNPPKEPRDLWTDDTALEVCSQHWAAFSRRYKGLPNSEVSFDLLNEPADIPEEVYAKVVRRLVAAIRAEDPNRLIVADGLKWGNKPVLSISDLKLAQSTRGYAPMEISHYRASWVDSGRFPAPVWPRLQCVGGTLASPSKGKDSHPIVVNGPFETATQLRLHVATVSAESTLVVEADGKPVFTKLFQPGAGAGEWKKSEFKKEWNIYQNVYDRDYMATIPAGARQVKLFVAKGDWVQLSELGFKPAASEREDVVFMGGAWNEAPEPFRYQPTARSPFEGLSGQDAAWLWKTQIEPWKKLESLGVGVHVGEWGPFNKTPHDVSLRWMEDCLSNWKKAGWGWSMWNFRGAFGPLDSGRADVRYEEYHGHKLDRQMMALLQKY